MELLKKIQALLGNNSGQPVFGGKAKGEPLVRRSNGLKEFVASWSKASGLRILDLGLTSSANLTYISNLGQKIHNEDLLRAANEPQYHIPATDSSPAAINAELFFHNNLNYEAASFDAVLLWDLADYIPEALVKPLVDRLSLLLKPGGNVLAYFHTREGSTQAPYCSYHIRDAESLELRPVSSLPLQRIFNNRNIENLFQGSGFRNIKFFLARDNLREVLVVR